MEDEGQAGRIKKVKKRKEKKSGETAFWHSRWMEYYSVQYLSQAEVN
jgi:hypothetical protein